MGHVHRQGALGVRPPAKVDFCSKPPPSAPSRFVLTFFGFCFTFWLFWLRPFIPLRLRRCPCIQTPAATRVHFEQKLVSVGSFKPAPHAENAHT
mmetsp:Transcript_64163/g.144734  ORF Transcript_64163/g.144734 Transcript_64163/m.144734 type:complete len:94 (+) Transcript_64163:1594-1875(+)